MKAAILYRAGSPFVIEEVAIANPAPGEVRIGVRASGLCQSDYSYAAGKRVCSVPALLGHEVSGVVTAVGAGVVDVAVGQPVVAAVPSCGACGECRTGHSQRCDDRPDRAGPPRITLDGRPIFQFVGVGGFAEEVLVDHRGVARVPDDVPLDEAALFGCAVVSGFGAVERCAGVAPGETVAVIGCGGVGLNIVQAARIAGASRIVAVDPLPAKRDLALALGATDAIAPGEALAQAVRALTQGGVHYAFEAVGRADTIAQSLRMLRKGGAAVLVGIPPNGAEVPLPIDLIFRDELRVLSTISGSMPLHEAVDRLSAYYRDGRLRLAPLIDRRISLDEINEGFAALVGGGATRVLIDFGLASSIA